VKRNIPCPLLAICCNSETEFVLRHEQARKGKRRETMSLKKKPAKKGLNIRAHQSEQMATLIRGSADQVSTLTELYYSPRTRDSAEM
jgi:hypothetical protein